MMRLSTLACALALASASWPQWPEGPVARVAAANGHAQHVAPGQKLFAQRRLTEAPTAPSAEDIAITHIILWTSIIMVITFYFAAMALAGMPVEGDSLLYSKAKSD